MPVLTQDTQDAKDLRDKLRQAESEAALYGHLLDYVVIQCEPASPNGGRPRMGKRRQRGSRGGKHKAKRASVPTDNAPATEPVIRSPCTEEVDVPDVRERLMGNSLP